MRCDRTGALPSGGGALRFRHVVAVVLDYDGRARRSDARQAARGRAFEPPGLEPSDASTVYLSWL
eukprot:6156940-Prymnesium_polylepis.1